MKARFYYWEKGN